MAESAVRVKLVGGQELTRDVVSHVMADAGFEILSDNAMPADTDVAIVVSDDDSPGRILSELRVKRAVVIADIDPNDDSVADLVLDGADAIINLQATVHDLADTVRVVANGGSIVAPNPARRLTDMARVSRAATAPDRPPLTNRELDILSCIGLGQSVKETARTLGITAKTVENLQSRLFRKLAARNRAQAFAQAHALGLLPTELDATAARMDSR